jgi:hypothetical protein
MKNLALYLRINLLAAAALLSACGGGGGNPEDSGDGPVAAAASFQGVWEQKCAVTPVAMNNDVNPYTGADVQMMATGDSYITITGSNEQLQISRTYYVYDVKDTYCAGKPILKLQTGGDLNNGKNQGSPEQGFIDINRGPGIYDRRGTTLVTSDINGAIGEKGILVTEFTAKVPGLFDTTEGNYPESGINKTPRATPFYKWGPFFFLTVGINRSASYETIFISREQERSLYTRLIVNPGVYHDFLTITPGGDTDRYSETELRDQAKKNLEILYNPGIGFKRITQIPDYEALVRSR